MRWTVLAAAVLAGCGRSGGAGLGSAGDLEVVRGFAYAPKSNSQMAAYVTIVNHGRTADTLYELHSARASMAMVHRQDPSTGVVRMEPTGPLAIAPGDSLVLAPGGLHVMLDITGTNPPQKGDSLPLTLRFSHAGPLTVALPVKAYEDES